MPEMFGGVMSGTTYVTLTVLIVWLPAASLQSIVIALAPGVSVTFVPLVIVAPLRLQTGTPMLSVAVNVRFASPTLKTWPSVGVRMLTVGGMTSVGQPVN